MLRRFVLGILLNIFIIPCFAQAQIVTPISWPGGNLYCTQTGDPEGICRWDNWYYVDNDGVTHNFPGFTVQKGILHPDGTITNLNVSKLATSSTDSHYFLSATGGDGSITVTEPRYPKFQLLAITYAAPGPSSGTEYSHSTAVGVNTDVSKSFTYTIGLKASVGSDENNVSLGVDYSHTSSTATSEGTKKTNSYSISSTNDNNFINHDYDRFDIWLNPQVNVSATSATNLRWNTTNNPKDTYLPLLNGQPQMDHIVVLAGWLNGNIPWPQGTDILQRLQRSWDTSIPNPGLTTADFAAILALDPFAQGIDPISGARLPIKSNAEIYNQFMKQGANRYTLVRSVNYTPVMQSISDSIGNVDEYAVTNTNTNELTVTAGAKFTFGAKIEATASWSWTHTVGVTHSSSNETKATYTIVTPDSTKPLPNASMVDIYQDNLYGTFMFVFPGGGF